MESNISSSKVLFFSPETFNCSACQPELDEPQCYASVCCSTFVSYKGKMQLGINLKEIEYV